MGKKASIRRARKLWPRSNNHDAEQRLAAAVHVSNINEGMSPIVSAPETGSYTEEEKQLFDSLIESEDGALDMYVLQSTMSSATFTNLYHSFEKGTKGRYQQIVDDLLSKGQSQFLDYQNLLSEAIENGDDLGQEQITSEISETAWAYLKEKAQ